MLKPFTAEGRFECGLADLTRGKVCAFVAVFQHQPNAKSEVGLGLAVANEPGYYPIPLNWVNADTYDEMLNHADELNREVFQLDKEPAARIVASSMRRRP